MPTLPITEPLPTNPTTDAPAYRSALESVRASLMAMPEDQIGRTPTLDASAAAVTAEASANKLRSFRSAIVAHFGAPAGTLVDELPVIARATRQADIELAGASLTTDLSAMHDQLRAEHLLLITDADSLANRKLIEPQRLDAARDLHGYQAVIRSVLVLVFVLRERWEQIESSTPLTMADLDRAEATAQRMSAALGDRDNGVSRAPAAELRVRALSKLVQHYEEIRRMISFLRWYQDDVDSIAPSLWAGRGRKSRSSGTDDNTSTDIVLPQAPVVPSPNNGGGPFTS